MDTLAARLAAFVTGATDDDFRARARRLAVDAITDCVGCMLAGSREPLASKLLAVAGAPGDAESAAPLVAGGRDASPADSALHGGAIAHALDYDDTNHPAYAHPSAVIVPAAFAVARLARASGRDVVTAYVLGLEVFGKLGRALNTGHYKRGWHATATFGSLAAAVVAGRLLRLAPPQLTAAIGIAASAAGGLRANFGSMVKPLHAGYAARNGVLAALLAREGLDASDESLDHRYGYVNVFNDGLAVDAAALASWGEPLEILTDYGLALKPYPSCGATHPGIEAALALRAELGDEAIRRVRVGVSEMALAPLIHVWPKTPLEGKFSMHYCIAAALVDGVVDLATFSEETMARPAIRSLVSKIAMEVDERVRAGSEFPTVVTIETDGGRRLERMVPLAAGKPERWFGEDQLRRKFLDCGSRACSADRLEQVLAMLRGLDGGEAVAPLLAALRDAASPARRAP